ncbi:MAG: ABC transporter permease [Coriobacteriales bacterium]|jgi:ABC-type multidrug transport system permease subunit|nr:ABC transporter permease [Coriobacteriales bacterium]
MLTTFLVTLKTLIRDRSVLIWAVAFPLVLSTLFVAMFSNLDELQKLDPIAVVIVEDANYTNAETFAETIDALASEDTDPDAEDGEPLLAPSYVANTDAALTALAEGSYEGFLQVDTESMPHYTMDARRVQSLGFGNPSQSVMQSILDRYVQDTGLLTTLAAENPALFANPAFIQSLTDGSASTPTERISVTANPPSDSQRYYYAVLAFSTIMMTTFALAAIDRVLGNTSPLGARRSLGGQSKLRMLAPTLAAAWLLGFACVLVGFLYLQLVFNIDFGGKEAATVLTLAVSVLAATLLGALLGALPVPLAVKSGLVAPISCGLSLFAGLYGPFSQNLGDWVARELPWLSACNPVRQVADAFFALYYYDGYAQLVPCLVSLLIFSLVFFVASVLIIRRQRYASL